MGKLIVTVVSVITGLLLWDTAFRWVDYILISASAVILFMFIFRRSSRGKFSIILGLACATGLSLLVLWLMQNAAGFLWLLAEIAFIVLICNLMRQHRYNLPMALLFGAGCLFSVWKISQVAPAGLWIPAGIAAVIGAGVIYFNNRSSETRPYATPRQGVAGDSQGQFSRRRGNSDWQGAYERAGAQTARTGFDTRPGADPLTGETLTRKVFRCNSCQSEYNPMSYAFLRSKVEGRCNNCAGQNFSEVTR